VLRLTYSSREKSPGRLAPTRIGRYQLIGKLANGGMAEAYLALSGELPALRSLVVVKRILPHLASQEQFVRMFLDEARIGALLDHPNIVRIIEVGQDGDAYFLAMEPVQGKPLSAVLRRAVGAKKPLGHAQAAFIVGQAANGLGYAHALTDAAGTPLNIVHRDISPQNILVSFDGAVKVIDFGVASALGRITETIPGGLKGKIEYMSPEQASGDSADRRSDIFALGVVLWEALCGRRLFRRRTELETMRAIFDEPIPRLPKAASVPPRLENIVMRALEREPEDRFQDAREMALLLQQHAFRSDGFNLIQLAAQMKSLFAADHAGWKAAANAGLNIEGNRSRKITASFSLATSPDSHTAERTVALQASSVPGQPRERAAGKRKIVHGEIRSTERASVLFAPLDGRGPHGAGTASGCGSLPPFATTPDVDGEGVADESGQGAHDRRPDLTRRAAHRRERRGPASPGPTDRAGQPGPCHQRPGSSDFSASPSRGARPQRHRDASHRSAPPGSPPPRGQSDRG
jgi:serine/threonine protein kinase